MSDIGEGALERVGLSNKLTVPGEKAVECKQRIAVFDQLAYGLFGLRAVRLEVEIAIQLNAVADLNLPYVVRITLYLGCTNLGTELSAVLILWTHQHCLQVDFKAS